MKIIIAVLIISGMLTGAQARNTAFQKLVEVNKCWLEQADIPRHIPMPCRPMDERAWIQYHLQLAEKTLRARSTAGLTPQQAAARKQSLDDLRSYRRAARFPVNDRYSIRTPIFIDRCDNFCAVGYLLKASGNEHLARMIAGRSNLAYVREMQYPELAAWADAHGFTIDELAWIQPGYPPRYGYEAVGKGTNGAVNTFYADNASGRLYVGGTFTMVDSSLPANHIAYLTESNGSFTWHALGKGIDGPIYAITSFKGKIFACGATISSGAGANNAAYWDDTGWVPAGCIGGGKILDLAVMGGELYAAGNFSFCTDTRTQNFARWDGADWQPITGLRGTVNTMQVMDTMLVLGGSFMYHSILLYEMKWSRNGGFVQFINAIENEVRDFELVGDTLFAACKRTSLTDPNLIYTLNGNGWKPLNSLGHGSGMEGYRGGNPAVYTLCLDGERLFVGGSFTGTLGMYGALNCMSINRAYRGLTLGEWFFVDSAVNKFARFKDYLFAGGSFHAGSGIVAMREPSVAVQATAPPADFYLSPNPVRSKGRLRIMNAGGSRAFTILDLSGREVMKGNWRAQPPYEIGLPELSPGVYLFRLEGVNGADQTMRFTVQ